MVTHPCINRAHDCLTSVIKHKTFAPCYVSPHSSNDINMSLLLAHSSLHHLEFMSQYGLLCISAESELGIVRVNKYHIWTTINSLLYNAWCQEWDNIRTFLNYIRSTHNFFYLDKAVKLDNDLIPLFKRMDSSQIKCALWTKFLQRIP